LCVIVHITNSFLGSIFYRVAVSYGLMRGDAVTAPINDPGEYKMKMCCLPLALALLMLPAAPGFAQVNIGIGVSLPGVNIGIDVPTYPDLVPVPGYPVYYAPGMDANYFFYDGMYWDFDGNNWYASTWYNGPWQMVDPNSVPLYVLRVPVEYYRLPPVFFGSWARNAPPRWDQHWGGGWADQHRGWDHWNRGSVPRAAPLPVYQRSFSGNKYPQAAQQQSLRSQNYSYQPHEAVVRQHFQAQAAPAAQRAQGAAENGRQEPAMRQKGPTVPRVEPAQRENEPFQKTAPVQQHNPAAQEHREGARPEAARPQSAPRPMEERAPQPRSNTAPAAPRPEAPHPQAAPHPEAPHPQAAPKPAPKPEEHQKSEEHK
jgi:hypothetical protein